VLDVTDLTCRSLCPHIHTHTAIHECTPPRWHINIQAMPCHERVYARVCTVRTALHVCPPDRISTTIAIRVCLAKCMARVARHGIMVCHKRYDRPPVCLYASTKSPAHSIMAACTAYTYELHTHAAKARLLEYASAQLQDLLGQQHPAHAHALERIPTRQILHHVWFVVGQLIDEPRR